MPTYKAPLRDISFCIRELFDFNDIRSLKGFEEFGDDLLDAVMNEYAKFCENEAFPLNQSGDEEGCTLENGEVTTPKGFKELYRKFMEAGWPSIASVPEYGGQGLPDSFTFLMQELMCSANLSFGMYPGLTEGAYAALLKHGADELKEKYLPNLVSGKWTGTMNLTEPQCGTDLGLITTKADPQGDGSYKITGTKIFISCGEHSLTENIIHLVLARTPTAPKGIKGISLFIVPKYMVNEDGSSGAKNSLECGALEHKMGIHGSSTCVMNYEGATGWLVGQENKGLNHMFTMMNTARLFVGIQGLGLAEVAYQTALNYARERLQGRALTGPKFPEKPADPIMVHPDVRRMLLTQKAYNEGNRMLCAWVARYLDISHRHEDEEVRKDADGFVQLMTPIVKAFLTDKGTDCISLAVQCHGGYGYIREYGVEQYLRDARIAQIYEGTNGIQALDLVGRKMPKDMGRYMRTFFHPVQEFIEEHKDNEEWKDAIGLLAKAFGRLQQASAVIAQKGLANPDEAGAASVDYLALFAHVSLAYLWTKAAMVAKSRLGQGEDDFYNSKLETARFYMTKLLPITSSLFASIMGGSSPVMDMKDHEFGPFEFSGHKVDFNESHSQAS